MMLKDPVRKEHPLSFPLRYRREISPKNVSASEKGIPEAMSKGANSVSLEKSENVW